MRGTIEKSATVGRGLVSSSPGPIDVRRLGCGVGAFALAPPAWAAQTAYVADAAPASLSGNVSAFTIAANGSLTPVAGSPFAAGNYPTGIAVTTTPKPPNTKLTKAKVSQKKRKATFEFKAKGNGEATGFQCSLSERDIRPTASRSAASRRPTST